MDAPGFVEYLKSKKPFVGSLLENLRVAIEGDSLVIFMEKASASIMDDAGQKEEIKDLLREYLAGK